MGTTAAMHGHFGRGDSGRALPPPGKRAAEAPGGLWARHLWAWLTGTDYRPERHYMRGGRADCAAAPRPRPA
jgi:hypothetical protein